MSSAHALPSDSSTDDRTTKARIRDAAIDCFAQYGVGGTTARKVASAAGVSPGSVIHHFGSMDGLRSACDEHVAATIRNYKRNAMAAGPGLDVLAALREADAGPLAAYLAAVLVDNSPTVATLVDGMIADAEGYLQQGVDTGMVRPSANPHGRAGLLTIWALGALVLHQHVQRILGVDLTDPEFGTGPAIASYVGPAYEILGGGILTESFTTHVLGSLPGNGGGEQDTESKQKGRSSVVEEGSS